KAAMLMAPAQPPFPSCRYLAFQADAEGNQRANLMLESRLGRMTPRTSQWAGTVPGVAGGAPGAAGAGAAPSGTLVAAVMSVYGSFRFTRFSHACCAYTAWLLNRTAAGMSHETLVSTLSPLPTSGRLHIGHTGRGQLRHGQLTHLELLNLAGHGHREFTGEADIARDLVGGDLAPTELAKLLHGPGDPFTQPDPRADLLAVLATWDADHLHVADLLMGVQELFDFTGIDVLAAADDHVLDAAGDRHVALIVHHGEIAAVHPASRVDRL